MDPFSIFVSVATLIEVGMRASNELSGIIRTWRGAPPAILALFNEVSDLNIVLDHTRNVGEMLESKGNKCDGDFLEALADHLYQARTLLNELEVLVLELKDLGTVKKKYKWLWRNAEAANLQHRLREIRARINELLITYNVSAVSRVELQLKEVHADMQRHHEVAMSTIEKAGVRIQNITHVQHISATTRGPSRKRSPEETQALASMLVRTLTSMNIANSGNVAMMEDKVFQVLESMEEENYPRTEKQAGLDSLAASVRKSGRALANPLSLGGFHSEAQNGETDSGVAPAVRFVAKPRLKCHSVCPCRCHVRKTPTVRLGSEVLGRLFVGYSGFPGTASACDSPACLSRGRLSVEVSYVFPVWFLHYAVSAIYRRTQAAGGPSLGLFITKRVGFDSGNILFAAWASDLDAVRRIISDDPYAVHYAMHTDGRTALHLALQHVRSNGWDWRVVRLLLQHGADPHAVDDLGRSAVANATRLMLEPNAGGGGESAKQQLAELFGTNSYIDHLDLSHITKVILGLCPGNVRQLIRRASPSTLETIRRPDALGYTPLWWAVVSNDEVAVQALIDAGVDVNRGMVADKVSPLSRAVGGARIEVVEALIRAGANIQARDSHGWQPIHWACRANAVDAIKLLHRRGVDLHSRISTGEQTPALIQAALYDSLEAMKYLVRHGVDINVEDRDGESALLSAVSNCSVRCLDWLLRREVNPMATVQSEGSGLLHLAAQLADEETMGLLARVGGFGLDWRARNGRGLTPADLFSERRSDSNELCEAFEALARAVESFTGEDDVCWNHVESLEPDFTDDEHSCLDLDSDDDDDFHDALDVLTENFLEKDAANETIGAVKQEEG